MEQKLIYQKIAQLLESRSHCIIKTWTYELPFYGIITAADSQYINLEFTRKPGSKLISIKDIEDIEVSADNGR